MRMKKVEVYEGLMTELRVQKDEGKERFDEEYKDSHGMCIQANTLPVES